MLWTIFILPYYSYVQLDEPNKHDTGDVMMVTQATRLLRIKRILS